MSFYIVVGGKPFRHPTDENVPSFSGLTIYGHMLDLDAAEALVERYHNECLGLIEMFEINDDGEIVDQNGCARAWARPAQVPSTKESNWRDDLAAITAPPLTRQGLREMSTRINDGLAAIDAQESIANRKEDEEPSMSFIEDIPEKIAISCANALVLRFDLPVCIRLMPGGDDVALLMGTDDPSIIDAAENYIMGFQEGLREGAKGEEA